MSQFFKQFVRALRCVLINRNFTESAMIFKYALFTFAVSLIPMIIILRDVLGSFGYMTEVIPVQFEFVSNILSSGIFTYLFDSNDDSKLKNENLQEIIFTEEELKRFNGQNGNTLYLAILGHIFDVSTAAKYYGPGETYNVFTGRDGSRAFVTGDFTDSGLTDAVEDLSVRELQSLNDWLKFYHKEYKYLGKLVGRYYDKNGKPTGYNHKIQLKLEEAEKDAKDKEAYKLMFPPCNVEWTPEQGSRVWCTDRSGGVKRDWIGVPRKLYEPGADTFRCACINEASLPQVITPETGKVRTRNIEEYEDCHPKSTSCYIQMNDN